MFNRHARAPLAMLVPYTFVPPRNGGQWAIFGYCRYLSEAWPLVVLGVEENAPTPYFEQQALFEMRPSRYVDPRVGWRVRKCLQRENIAYLAMQHHYLGLLLWPFTIGLGLKWLVFSHNLEYQRWRSLGKWWWPLMWLSEWWVYRRADRVFFVSRDDRDAAPRAFGLPPERCVWAPFGVNQTASPPPADSRQAREAITARHGFSADERLCLFFGPQQYAPNLEAVLFLLREVWPLLPPDYRLLICGGGLPEAYRPLLAGSANNVSYLGYVEDIEQYVLGCDLVLNPIFSGGGVKTKLIEAVGLGKTVVSSANGALGVDPADFGQKLVIVPDHDAPAFAAAIRQALSNEDLPTPPAFYARHYWGNAVRPVVDYLEGYDKL